jgi:hypothetical protein
MCAATFDRTMMKQMMDHALDLSARKMRLVSGTEMREAITGGNCKACGYLRHALAEEMARYLGSLDGSVKAVYTYEPEYATAGDGYMPNVPATSPAINMIAWVEQKSAALSSVVNILGAALKDEFERLECPKANALCRMVDIKIIDDQEVHHRTGYGALVNSTFVRPLEVWHR